MAEKREKNTVELKLRLNDLKDEDENPKLALHALCKDGNVLASDTAKDGQSVRFSADVLKEAKSFALMSPDEKPQGAALKSAYRIAAPQVARLAERGDLLQISPNRWRPLLPFFRCVDGKVRKCWWWPFYVDAFQTRVAKLAPLTPIGQATATLAPQLTLFPIPFRRCKPVCEGVVEIYERICCCNFVLTPPLIVDICDRLKDIIHHIPKPKIPEIRPPRPQPDPVPFEKAGIFQGGTLGLTVAQAQADMDFIESASFAQAEDYILARPHLIRWLCSCGTAVYKGSTLIGPGGEFSHCFPSSPFLLYNCHREYAFRVRQIIDGVNTVIYDGLAANQWFDEGDDVTLTSYLPSAVDCDDDDIPIPTDMPFAMLERIGSTEAWNLKTPAPSAWDSASITSYNDGLCFPAATIADARGKMKNCNWGGDLHLRYLFTEALKATGARFYRISVRNADTSGNATGTAKYLDAPVTWKYYENLGGYPPTSKSANGS